MKRYALAAMLVLGVITLVAFSRPDPSSLAAESSTSPRSAGKGFMRAKLATTQKIVEGLATENFSLIEEGAAEWMAICESASWRVRRDPVYMHYSADFQNMAARLKAMAKKQSIEGATFAYVHVTVCCMSCHQHVRGVVHVAPRTGNSQRIRRQ